MSFNAEEIAETFNNRNVAERERIAQRLGLARQEAQRLALAIKKGDATVKAVYLFGSVAEGTARNENFDIDLAMEGGDLYAALDIAEESEFDVDLVSLDRLPSHLRERVLERGLPLQDE